ncbi:MAG: alkaline phosphatase [Bacteroidales bacterium]|jgi:alkaline phosphatase|nr:alkaline phosphatase [Bacteroidales bacterium]
MKQIACTVIVVLFLFGCSSGRKEENVRPVKNVIVMIPDGTSIGVVSAARWYMKYLGQGDRLNIDPYLCGTVSTFCSNAPIGDSAPTTSCYMTGIPMRKGYVATGSPVDSLNDLIPLDPFMAYQPLATVLEAARIVQKKSTGLVVTCEFPHATPADCSAHYYDRNNYPYIASQMAHNRLDVMFGGGNNFVTPEIADFFKTDGTTLLQNDRESFRNHSADGKMWALFEKTGHPYDLDRDTSKIPSLEEMTRKALTRLSKNPNGFFLMVEGSHVDYAAHDNDAVACITEFLAFDKAVGAVMEFAHNNRETAVIILPDHGNSGFTTGRRGCGSPSSSLADLFGVVAGYKKTAAGMEAILKETPPEQIKAVFEQYAGINVTDDEILSIIHSKDYTMGDYTGTGNNQNMQYSIIQIMNSRTCFGFTSGQHTAEEVFLAAYHPYGDIPLGMHTNVEINEYLCKVMGLDISLPELTRKIFAKHTEVCADYPYTVSANDKFPILTVSRGQDTLTVPAFGSVAYLNHRPLDMGSVAVYMDKNSTFYLPADILKRIQW